ncbi:amidohydrolase family protein [Carboxylicivirga marina]|uniref:amidohydrolase family protein n=1 Tax=Carboxylicivirga marina TaxID=2800988 RepID=UPI002598A8CC|nr:amidohydrolase family protein [uncultured Carboxylicivirga sp.]
MDYVLIKNGKIVVDGELYYKDVLIGNDKLMEISEGIERPEPETPVIDAKGKLLIPGTIDTNIFFSELISSDDAALKRFNQAQISAGTTTVLEPILPEVSFSFREELIRKKKINYGINADYGYHLSMSDWDILKGADIDYCYAHEGIASFYLKWPVKQDDKDALERLLHVTGKDSTPVLIDMQRPVDVNVWYESLSDEYLESINSHLAQMKEILELSVQAKCTICILNVCFKEELELIERFSANGNVYAELLFPFHIADSDKMVIDNRSVYFGFPLVDKLNLLAEADIWRCLTKENFLLAKPMNKLSGQGVVKSSQVDNRPDEYILMKNLLSVMYTWGVARGKISCGEWVNLISCRPARFMGVFPQKGTLRVGSDADIVVWNPDYKRNLYCHLPGVEASDGNPFPLEGRVEFVFIKGCMVYNGENFNSHKVNGRYLYRSPYL